MRQEQGQPQQGDTGGEQQRIHGVDELHAQGVLEVAHDEDHQNHLGQPCLLKGARKAICKPRKKRIVCSRAHLLRAATRCVATHPVT